MANADSTPRGKLKVYLGYAAGVGKTFQMLADGQAAARRAVDVVLAYFEPHARPDTIAQTQGLEVIPHRKVEYSGTWFQELDTEAVLKRRPSIALVDELAHTNIAGSLMAGISAAGCIGGINSAQHPSTERTRHGSEKF